MHIMDHLGACWHTCSLQLFVSPLGLCLCHPCVICNFGSLGVIFDKSKCRSKGAQQWKSVSQAATCGVSTQSPGYSGISTSTTTKRGSTIADNGSKSRHYSTVSSKNVE